MLMGAGMYAAQCMMQTKLKSLLCVCADTYKVIASGQIVSIHPSSVLSGRKPRCIVFDEILRTTRNYARNVTVMEPSWLPEVVPAFFRKMESSGGL